MVGATQHSATPTTAPSHHRPPLGGGGRGDARHWQPALQRLHFAWLVPGFVHVYFLIGFRNRFIVLMDWAWSYLTFNRTARVVAGTEKFESENARRREYVGADRKRSQ